MVKYVICPDFYHGYVGILGASAGAIASGQPIAALITIAVGLAIDRVLVVSIEIGRNGRDRPGPIPIVVSITRVSQGRRGIAVCGSNKVEGNSGGNEVAIKVVPVTAGGNGVVIVAEGDGIADRHDG